MTAATLGGGLCRALAGAGKSSRDRDRDARRPELACGEHGVDDGCQLCYRWSLLDGYWEGQRAYVFLGDDWYVFSIDSRDSVVV